MAALFCCRRPSRSTWRRQGTRWTILSRYQAEILIPNGIRLMSQAVRQIAQGTELESPQQPGRPARRRATYRQQQELRRLVALRRSRSRVTPRAAQLTSRLPES